MIWVPLEASCLWTQWFFTRSSVTHLQHGSFFCRLPAVQSLLAVAHSTDCTALGGMVCNVMLEWGWCFYSGREQSSQIGKNTYGMSNTRMTAPIKRHGNVETGCNCTDCPMVVEDYRSRSHRLWTYQRCPARVRNECCTPPHVFRDQCIIPRGVLWSHRC
jgi:hypothetical protein